MELLERRIFGSRLQEIAWSMRHLFHREWTDGYQATLAHPHRSLLVEAIARYLPQNVLEVGCNVGANLALLARCLPDCELHGVDINRTAIRHGRQWLADLPRVHLRVGRASRLPYSDGSMDVVFTDATLMCVGPDAISGTLAELLRVARTAVVLNEFVCTGPSRYLDGHWLHDYAALFPTCGVKARPLPPWAWDDPVWQQYGCLVELRR